MHDTRGQAVGVGLSVDEGRVRHFNFLRYFFAHCILCFGWKYVKVTNRVPPSRKWSLSHQQRALMERAAVLLVRFPVVRPQLKYTHQHC